MAALSRFPMKLLPKEEIKKTSIESFLEFFSRLQENLLANLSNVIKILLNIIHYTVIDTFKVESKNYHAVKTVLFFRFLICPTVQEIYDLYRKEENNEYLTNLNRLINVS